MGLDIGSITVAMYDKQGKSNGRIGMGASGADGKIDAIEFRSALTNVLSDKLSSLSFNKKIDLMNYINSYSINTEIVNDKDFQEQLRQASEYLSNKLDKSSSSWAEPQFKDENNHWSQFKWY